MIFWSMKQSSLQQNSVNKGNKSKYWKVRKGKVYTIKYSLLISLTFTMFTTLLYKSLLTHINRIDINSKLIFRKMLKHPFSNKHQIKNWYSKKSPMYPPTLLKRQGKSQTRYSVLEKKINGTNLSCYVNDFLLLTFFLGLSFCKLIWWHTPNSYFHIHLSKL